MINLKLAKQLEARAMRQLRELERTLRMAKQAGIEVRRFVQEDSSRLCVRLLVNPQEAEMPVRETEWTPGTTFAWREGRGDGRLYLSKEPTTPEEFRKMRDCRLVDVRLHCLEDLPDHE